MASVRKREWEYNGVKKSAWEVRYLDQEGKHRSKSFAKKKDADAYRSKVETEINTGLHAAEAQKKTMNFVADEFLRQMQQRQRAGEIGLTYYRRLENDFRLKVRPTLGNMKLGDIKLSTMTDWYYRLLEGGQSPRSARIATHCVKMMLDFAMRRDWVASNPATMLLKETRQGERKTVATFTKAQIEHLLNVVALPMYVGRRPRSNLRMQCFVHLAVFCGLRVGEILGLKLENIDFDNRILKIRNSLSKLDGLKGPKSRAGNRDIGLPVHIADLLMSWRDNFYKENKLGLMFVRPNGSPLHTESFRGLWGRLLHRAGMSADPTKPEYHFHALRHFAASWRVHQGVPLPIVAKEMGHSKVDMTLSVYTHALDHGTATADAAQNLSDQLVTSPKIVVPQSLAQDVRTSV